MTAADRARRDRARLIAAAERAQRKRSHALAQAVRTADRLAELDEVLKAAAAGLDAAEDREATP